MFKNLHRSPVSGAVIGLAALAATGLYAAHDDAINFPYLAYDHEAIQYPSRPPNDPVSRLQRQIDSGAVTLNFDDRYSYLPSVLKHLGINSDSQMLVFSKTSFQAPKISPRSPRALYFSDDVAVGYVPQGEVIEVIATDPRQGAQFYTLDLAKSAKPAFVRRSMECLQCHMIPSTLNVPGLEIASVIVAPDGSQRFPGAGTIVDSRTPLNDRWGGWYVTGTAGKMRSRANAVAPYPDRPNLLDDQNAQNLTTLRDRLDTTPYLNPTSDIVALMTIEHQARMTDLLIRLGWETRVAEQDGKNEEFRKSRMNMIVDQLTNYMLFADEAKISDPITGVSTFTNTFPARGPRDKHGRSLRDFDLKTRLFRYPLSYMIYSDLFDSLPEVAKQAVYQHLYDALTGKVQGGPLSAEDCRAVIEILRDTKTNLPAYWN
jgi:hypothetical protein